ncbi:hypothetical protein AB0H83_13275 [Dactylosporangium sp. NPDC050688]|uniref:hypothetical protein n=1 Tax=Dactylosporangium sp. NPDC050688 TaxID=3157217 RepID=UPI0033E35D4C
MDPVTPMAGDVNVRELTITARDTYSGGNSSLHSCRLRGRPLLFKEYSPEHLKRVNATALGLLVGWRESLPADDRARLDQATAWPRHRVTDEHGRLHGVLMPAAPARFIGRLSWNRPAPRTIGGLTRRSELGIVRAGATPAVKRMAIGRAAEAVLWLHRREVIVNDLQMENILSAADGSAVYLVDCDAMIGPWGAVCPPQAPPYMRDVVPDADNPTVATDLARLSWVAIGLLLDAGPGIVEIPPGALRGLDGGDQYGKLLTWTADPRGSDAPVTQWHELVSAWTGAGFADAGAGAEQPPIEPQQPADAPAPTPPVEPALAGDILYRKPAARPLPRYGLARRRRSHEWLPTRFRVAADVTGPAGGFDPWLAPLADAPARPTARAGAKVRPMLRVVAGIAALTVLLAVLDLLGVRP